jgi:hypothetical protein
MENGNVRLMIQNFGKLKSFEVAPTIVETEFYEQGKSHPQQRGFHIDLTSPLRKDHQFLTALCIQDKKQKANDFKATRISERCIELADGSDICRIWVGDQTDLSGSYAFILKSGNKVKRIGFYGRRFNTPYGVFTQSKKGPLVLNTDGKGSWKQEGDAKNSWRIE